MKQSQETEYKCISYNKFLSYQVCENSMCQKHKSKAKES